MLDNKDSRKTTQNQSTCFFYTKRLILSHNETTTKMATINSLVRENENLPKADSIKKRLERAGAPHGLNDNLSKEAVELLKEWYGLRPPGNQPNQPKPDPPTRPSPPKPKPKPQPKHIPEHKETESRTAVFMATMPLAMLGLAASFGVYHFAQNFVPMPFAVAEAAAFEITYISLARLRFLSTGQRQQAERVAMGAVFVSVVYNSLSAWSYINPGLFDGLDWPVQLVLSVTHGLPIAILAYQVSRLNIER